MDSGKYCMVAVVVSGIITLQPGTGGTAICRDMLSGPSTGRCQELLLATACTGVNTSGCAVELQTKLFEDYAKFYHANVGTMCLMIVSM